MPVSLCVRNMPCSPRNAPCSVRCNGSALAAVALLLQLTCNASLQESLKFALHGKRSRVQAADINHALELRDMDPMHGFGASDRRRYAAVAGASDVFYVQDTLHSCEDLVYEPPPSPPVEVGVLMHWFLVRGIKPRIPENAVPAALLARTRALVRLLSPRVPDACTLPQTLARS